MLTIIIDRYILKRYLATFGYVVDVYTYWDIIDVSKGE
jgi:hypothetical protein